MRTNTIATVVNNVITDRNDRVNVVAVAVLRSHGTHSTRFYCTHATEAGEGKPSLLAGKKPVFPMAMPFASGSLEAAASQRLWCSQRHLGSLVSRIS